jgi:hypothetical protein
MNGCIVVVLHVHSLGMDGPVGSGEARRWDRWKEEADHSKVAGIQPDETVLRSEARRHV